MSTDLVTTSKSNALVVGATRSNFEGDVSDILIPRIYAAQKTSKVLEDSTAKLGHLVRSTTNEVLGGLGAPVKVIPLKHWKSWMTTSDGKFVGIEPYTHANSTQEFEFIKDGRKFKRERVLNFYILLPQDITDNLAARRQFAETGELPEKLSSLVPCQIGFKSTSYKAGRTLVSHFAQMEDLGAKPYMRWLALDTELGQNDKGKFGVLKISESGSVKDKEVLAVCEKWSNILQTANVKLDESNMDAEVADFVDVPQEF